MSRGKVDQPGALGIGWAGSEAGEGMGEQQCALCVQLYIYIVLLSSVYYIYIVLLSSVYYIYIVLLSSV